MNIIRFSVVIAICLLVGIAYQEFSGFATMDVTPVMWVAYASSIILFALIYFFMISALSGKGLVLVIIGGAAIALAVSASLSFFATHVSMIGCVERITGGIRFLYECQGSSMIQQALEASAPGSFAGFMSILSIIVINQFVDVSAPETTTTSA